MSHTTLSETVFMCDRCGATEKTGKLKPHEPALHPATWGRLSYFSMPLQRGDCYPWQRGPLRDMQ